jgi:hypothetical protein
MKIGNEIDTLLGNAVNRKIWLKIYTITEKHRRFKVINVTITSNINLNLKITQ